MAAAYEYLTRAEVESRLAPYGGHFRATIYPGTEIWATGWGDEFSLTLELDGVRYDEWQIIQAIETVIEPSKPTDWLLAERPGPPF